MKNYVIGFVLFFLLTMQFKATGQTIQKQVNGQWINWCYINGSSIQYVENNKWTTYGQLEGDVIKVKKEGQWVNQFYIKGTTAKEAIKGEWVKRYYPKGDFVEKQVNGQWHRQWKVNGNYIQEWKDFGWYNMYYFPDGYQNLTLMVCFLDIGKYKTKKVSAPKPTISPSNTSRPPVAGGSGNSERQSAPRPAPAPHSNNNNNPSVGNCRGSHMNDSDFSELLEAVNDKTYDNDKVMLAKQVTKVNCLTSSQVKQIMETLTYDSGRLEFAKYAYPYVYDQGKYYTVNDAFTYSSNSKELSKFVTEQ